MFTIFIGCKLQQTMEQVDLIIYLNQFILRKKNSSVFTELMTQGTESSSLQQRALYVKDSRAPCSSLHSASWLMHCLDQVTAELCLLLSNLFLSPNARPRRELRSLREKTEGVIFSVTKLFFSIIISLHRTTKE